MLEDLFITLFHKSKGTCTEAFISFVGLSSILRYIIDF